jgi:hypothetical protein
MKKNVIKGIQGLVAVVVLGLFISVQAAGASACKGVSKSKCAANNRCSWVGEYTTKKGVSVGPFCRSKSGKGSSSSAAAASRAKVKKSRTAKKKSLGKDQKAAQQNKKAVNKKKKSLKSKKPLKKKSKANHATA